VLRAWLQLTQDVGERCEEETADLNLTLSTLKEIDKNALTHRCSQCGFGTLQQHWLCPSCRNWSTTKPLPVG
jgi:lipopolysaccharide assembly protein B